MAHISPKEMVRSENLEGADQEVSVHGFSNERVNETFINESAESYEPGSRQQQANHLASERHA